MKLPITVIIAAKNEAVNMENCIRSLAPAGKVYVIDSHSSDETVRITQQSGAETVQFDYKGGYPRKRQWAITNLPISTEWIMLVDADETIGLRCRRVV